MGTLRHGHHPDPALWLALVLLVLLLMFSGAVV